MRDCWKNRAGYDRVLVTVAAAFLTLSATSALAQGDQIRSPAELAIDAAIPRPEPANVPPPTPADFKLDPVATAPEATQTPEVTKKTETAAPEAKPSVKPADVATVPISEPTKIETSKTESGNNES